MTEKQDSSVGLLYALGAFFSWGLLPLFWKLLDNIDPFIVLAQRVVWSVVFILLILLAKNHWLWISHAVKDRETVLRYLSSSILLGVNWGLYIWAVNNNFVIETSLGYYMNPLFTVLLGAIFLGEKPRTAQWVSVFIAALGVIFLTFLYGRLPLIGTILGITFAMYSVVKKNGKLTAIEEMTVESVSLLPFAIVYLGYIHYLGKGAFGTNLSMDILLILSGVVTQIPLLLFSATVKRLSVTTLGVVGFLSPTTAFLLGVLYFKEPFSSNELIGYSAIWLALIVFTIEGIVQQKMHKYLNPPH